MFNEVKNFVKSLRLIEDYSALKKGERIFHCLSKSVEFINIFDHLEFWEGLSKEIVYYTNSKGELWWGAAEGWYYVDGVEKRLLSLNEALLALKLEIGLGRCTVNPVNIFSTTENPTCYLVSEDTMRYLNMLQSQYKGDIKGISSASVFGLSLLNKNECSSLSEEVLSAYVCHKFDGLHMYKDTSKDPEYIKDFNKYCTTLWNSGICH